MNLHLSQKEKVFIDKDKLYGLLEGNPPDESALNDVLDRSLKLKGLSLEDVAVLLRTEKSDDIKRIMEAAKKVKEEIYGKRLVVFAPLYTGNKCSNNCLYCGFRTGNKNLKRVVLGMDEIRNEVLSLLKDGHKRLLMLCGESNANSLDYFLEAITEAYSVRYVNNYIRRINVEIAPLSVEDFKRLKERRIGTYACFQETYEPDLYKKYHLSGPKTDYEARLTVMDRAMLGGIDDVGIGVLFGLAPYGFDVLSIVEHAAHLEKEFGCGPHTVSVPRIEPADNAPASNDIPYPVSDLDFKKIISIIRLALPYTGIILSTRESEELRTELFNYGVSQVSAGSRTNPGAYSNRESDSGSQFSLGDHRSLDEIISSLIDREYIPSFCTGCYRKGRVGNDFMDLAKPGLIKEFCMPNGLFTFKEYLNDFATEQTRKKGNALIEKITGEIENESLREKIRQNLKDIDEGKRDIYF
jgi:2-iminoacetate synthase